MGNSSLFSLLLLSFDSDFLLFNTRLCHADRSHPQADMTYINIALATGLAEETCCLSTGGHFSCLLSCELLQSLLICASTHQWVLCHLTTYWKQTSLSQLVSVKSVPKHLPAFMYLALGNFTFFRLIGLREICLLCLLLWEQCTVKDWVYFVVPLAVSSDTLVLKNGKAGCRNQCFIVFIVLFREPPNTLHLCKCRITQLYPNGFRRS